MDYRLRKSIGEDKTTLFDSLTNSDIFSVLFILKYFFNFNTNSDG